MDDFFVCVKAYLLVSLNRKGFSNDLVLKVILIHVVLRS